MYIHTHLINIQIYAYVYLNIAINYLHKHAPSHQGVLERSTGTLYIRSPAHFLMFTRSVTA